MPDLFHLTPEMNQYFNALPESVKENIIQSGAQDQFPGGLKGRGGTTVQPCRITATFPKRKTA